MKVVLLIIASAASIDNSTNFGSCPPPSFAAIVENAGYPDTGACTHGCNGHCADCCTKGQSSSSCACNWGCCNPDPKPPSPPPPPSPTQSFSLAGTYNNAAASKRSGTTEASSLNVSNSGVAPWTILKIEGHWTNVVRPSFSGQAALKQAVTSWTEKSNVALDCKGSEPSPGCLGADEGHGCTGEYNAQCTWDSVKTAKKECGAWDDCEGIYYSTGFVDGGTLLCFVRGHSAITKGVQPAKVSTDIVFLMNESDRATIFIGSMDFPDDHTYKFSFSSSTGQIKWDNGNIWQHDTPPAPPAPPADCFPCDCSSNDGGWNGRYYNCEVQKSRSDCGGYCVYCNSKAQYVGHSCPAPPAPPAPPAAIVDCKWTAPSGNKYDLSEAEFPADGRDWALAGAKGDEKYIYHYNFCKGTKTYGTNQGTNFHCEKGETALCQTSADDTKQGWSYPIGVISKYVTPTVTEIPASEIAELMPHFTANFSSWSTNGTNSTAPALLGACPPPSSSALLRGGSSPPFVAVHLQDSPTHCTNGCNGHCEDCCPKSTSTSNCECIWGCCNIAPPKPTPPAPPTPPHQTTAGIKNTYHHVKTEGVKREAVVNILCDESAEEPVFSAVHHSKGSEDSNKFKYIFTVKSIVGCANRSPAPAAPEAETQWK